jgi:hypothetical protein
MGKFLQIDYPDGRLVLVGKISRSRLGPLEALLQCLQQRWMECDQSIAAMTANPAIWEIFEAIAAMLPRYDRPGQHGIDIKPLQNHWDILEGLFLYQRQGEEYSPCRLVELLQFTPTPRPKWQDTEDANDKIPPPTDDPEMDSLSGLAVSFSVSEALQLWDRLDAESLDRFLAHVNELRRDPEDRQMENLAQDFAAWKQENASVYEDALGLKPRRPDQPAPPSQ